MSGLHKCFKLLLIDFLLSLIFIQVGEKNVLFNSFLEGGHCLVIFRYDLHVHVHRRKFTKTSISLSLSFSLPTPSLCLHPQNPILVGSTVHSGTPIRTSNYTITNQTTLLLLQYIKPGHSSPAPSPPCVRSPMSNRTNCHV